MLNGHFAGGKKGYDDLFEVIADITVSRLACFLHIVPPGVSCLPKRLYSKYSCVRIIVGMCICI